MLLNNKIAIITGATRGIGRAIAEEFAKNGALLILNGTNEKLLNDLEEQFVLINKNHTIVKGDISDPKTAENLINIAMHLHGRVDILVNNAGINMHETTEKMSLTNWQKVLDVNLNGTLCTCKAVMPIMKKQRSGKIINISSRAAKHPKISTSPSYGASKAAIIYLTRHLAAELGEYGINVNVVCPGPIETDMIKIWSDAYRKEVLSLIPLKRYGKPEEVAHTVVFLASNLSDFITGETVNVNGGRSMD